MKGFTLVEMMVVVGILAVLSLMTLPSLLERNVREQINEALPLADLAKPPVAQAWAASQPLPLDNAAAGLPPAEQIVGNYVKSVALHDGAIDLTFGNQASKPINGKVLTLRPAVVQDTPLVPVAWVCGNARVPDKMAVKGENRTSVPPIYLPLKCRP